MRLIEHIDLFSVVLCSCFYFLFKGGRCCEARVGGSRQRRQLGFLPPNNAAHCVWRRRPADQALEDERQQGKGVRRL